MEERAMTVHIQEDEAEVMVYLKVHFFIMEAINEMNLKQKKLTWYRLFCLRIEHLMHVIILVQLWQQGGE